MNSQMQPMNLQMAPQNNVYGLQQESMLGTQSGNSAMPTNQHSMQMLQQSEVPVQQQIHQNAPTLLPSQNQQSQPQPSQQQMVSHIQSQSVQLQSVQQRFQTSCSLLQQQKQLFQSQRANPEASLTSLDFMAQTGNANVGDWQEEVYQKIKTMKDMYFLELNELFVKIATKVQQHYSLSHQQRNEPLEKLMYFKVMLERLIGFLRCNKNDIQITHKDKLVAVEKQIINILNSASLDSTAQTGNANGGDWQEEVYQKIKTMKDMYILELNELFVKVATKVQKYNSLPHEQRNEQLEKLRYFKVMLERVIGFLRCNKNDIQITHKDKLVAVENHIISILNSVRPRRPVTLQQGQLPQSQMPAMQHSQPQSQISQMPPL